MNHAPGDNSVVLYDALERQGMRFEHPVEILRADRTDEVRGVLQRVARHTETDRLTAAGFVCYEAAPAFDAALTVLPPVPGLPTAWFGLYERALPFVAPDSVALAPETPQWTPDIGPETYRRDIDAIRRHISQGDTYQVNHTFRLEGKAPDDPWQLFLRLIRAQRPRYGAWVRLPGHILCSSSPELFFDQHGDRIVTRPMKGTAARGLWSMRDRARADALRRSPKNRAENLMIVDMIRNDLGRIARPGSVKVRDLCKVEQYPTVWQMTSTVTALSEGYLPDIFEALFPCASITGAPKAAAMRIIAEREASPRGVYCGAIGFCAPDRRARFNVAIRTVHIETGRNHARYGIGGGIVWDSRTNSEYAECLNKAAVLTHIEPEFDLLETMRWEPGAGISNLKAHLARLRTSARYFAREIDVRDIRLRIISATEALPSQPHRIRLRVPERSAPVLECAPLLPLPDPARVRVAAHPINPADRFLYHKTTCRKSYTLALESHPDADDVLLWNPQGELTESCIANVLVRIDGEWRTPPIRCGLLPGTRRAAWLRAKRARETVIRIEDIDAKSEIMLVNAVRERRAVLY